MDTRRTTPTIWRSLALSFLLSAAVLALAVSSGYGGARQTEASGPPNPDFSLEVADTRGCDTDSDPPEGGCHAPAATFTARVRLNSIEGLEDHDGDGEAGYEGVQVRLNFSEGLSVREGRIVGVWPDCALPASHDKPGSFVIFCHTGFAQVESGYLGPVVEVDFDCPAEHGSEQITLVHSTSDPASFNTFIADDWTHVIRDKDPNETLTIACTEPPLPPPPPPSPGAMAVDCDAATAGVQAACSYETGASFGVQVHVTEPPTGGFLAFQVYLAWDAPPLDYLPADDPAVEALWQHCDLPERPPFSESPVVFSCLRTSPLSSGDTSAGAVLQFEFSCQEDGAGLAQLLAGDPLSVLTTFTSPYDGAITPGVTGASITCGGDPPSSPPDETTGSTGTVPSLGDPSPGSGGSATAASDSPAGPAGPPAGSDGPSSADAALTESGIEGSGTQPGQTPLGLPSTGATTGDGDDRSPWPWAALALLGLGTAATGWWLRRRALGR